jgi:hypothetical protein
VVARVSRRRAPRSSVRSDRAPAQHGEHVAALELGDGRRRVGSTQPSRGSWSCSL